MKLRVKFSGLKLSAILLLIVPLMANNVMADDELNWMIRKIIAAENGCDTTIHTLDTTILPPLLHQGEKYTNNANVNLSWDPIIDSGWYDVGGYLVISFTDENLETLLHCDPVLRLDTFFYSIPTNYVYPASIKTGYHYIRVAGLFTDSSQTDPDMIDRRGPWSNTISIVYDTVNPSLDTFWVTDRDDTAKTTWTDDNTVRVIFSARDSFYLKDLELSEDPDFWNSTLIPLDTTGPLDSHTTRYSMSLERREKIIYARVIDGAGNLSNIMADTIDLFDSGVYAHCYPNPFNPGKGQHTNLVFHMDNGGDEVTIRIFDLFGNLVYTDKVTGQAGSNDGGRNDKLRWRGTDDQGNEVASGGYIGVISIPGEDDQKIKIAVIK